MSDVVGQATRLELLSVADPELLLIDTDGAGEVTAYEATLEVVEVGDTTALIESSEQLSLLDEAEPDPKPAPKKSKRKRAAVPSWDEIMFGAPRQGKDPR